MQFTQDLNYRSYYCVLKNKWIVIEDDTDTPGIQIAGHFNKSIDYKPNNVVIRHFNTFVAIEHCQGVVPDHHNVNSCWCLITMQGVRGCDEKRFEKEDQEENDVYVKGCTFTATVRVSEESEFITLYQPLLDHMQQLPGEDKSIKVNSTKKYTQEVKPCYQEEVNVMMKQRPLFDKKRRKYIKMLNRMRIDFFDVYGVDDEIDGFIATIRDSVYPNEMRIPIAYYESYVEYIISVCCLPDTPVYEICKE